MECGHLDGAMFANTAFENKRQADAAGTGASDPMKNAELACSPRAAASILKDGRVVFNIAGNKYRIVVWINYPYRVVYIRFIGAHRQYDKIDAQTI